MSDFVSSIMDRVVARNPAEPDGTDEFKGLGINCEHRKECVHAKRVGGVWFCEQY